MKYRILAVFLTIAVFFAVAPRAHAEESAPVNFFILPFKLLIKKLETRKENKEANKNVRNEIIERQRGLEASSPSPTPASLADYLAQSGDRLLNIADRIDSRIRKTESEDISLDDAKKELALAREKMALAREIVRALASSTAEVPFDMRSSTEKALEHMSDARRMLEKATALMSAKLGN